MRPQRPSDMGIPSNAVPTQPTYILTRREYEVLALLTAGYPMKQIAYRLGITYSTVTFYKCVRTNAGLVQYAVRNGVLKQNTAEKNLAAA
jgi:DNA-binding CsgD family transcriptional regulator